MHLLDSTIGYMKQKNNIKISYAITVCNELQEAVRLIDLLHTHKRGADEICVLLDKPKASPELENYLIRCEEAGWIVLREDVFDHDFADWKNILNSMCTGDYIFQIDADEYPNPTLIENLPVILQSNPDVDLYMIPRINTVSGLTDAHIQKWGWFVNERGWVNFPDSQYRIYKNISYIRWDGRVHERITGFKKYTMLPPSEEFCLYHPKTIERQEKQNDYYETL